MTDKMHPVQATRLCQITSAVTLRAYEVYAAVHGEQPAMITDGCRGGFGVGELLAFLYARSFPKSEWRQRVDEALSGMSSVPYGR